ncbi:unnamed protein product [Owenia fusiformis]|uniref:Uncharacterized protein n=1 Tax=Owenia fusiformis TaxID=6347 RepID=A0A8J1XSJ0_OWEFU|nr:unnamed protein product [Owenia fusiformis]
MEGEKRFPTLGYEVMFLTNLSVDISPLNESSSWSDGSDMNVSGPWGRDISNHTTVELVLTPHSLPHIVITSLVLGLMILATIIGNVFVIAAIALERSLQGVANYLVASLALCDLLVAALVMPLSLISEISSVWFLGAQLCNMYVSFDVLCCTASILHLVCIALDRYWAVTRIDYMRSRTAKRMLIMILIVWFLAVCITIPPHFGLKSEQDDPDVTGVCMVSTHLAYRIFATIGAFYLPLVIILIIYGKIFKAAKSRIRKKSFRGYCATPSTIQQNSNDVDGDDLSVTEISPTCNISDSPERTCADMTNGDSLIAENGRQSRQGSPIKYTNDHQLQTNGNSLIPLNNGYDRNYNNKKKLSNAFLRVDTVINTRKRRQKQKVKSERLEIKRERKAARTLAIVTGAFIVCWLPFFIGELVSPFCSTCNIPPVVLSIIMWLGYLNSLLNPVIYTVFNPDFRKAFKKILFGKYGKAKVRGRGCQRTSVSMLSPSYQRN